MCQTVYPLAAYGDVTTLAGAQQAWAAAVMAAGQCGGGVIELSAGTHAAFKVRQSHPGITVVDARGGTLRIQAPVLDDTAIPDGYPEGGVSIVRTRQEPAPLVGEFSAQSVLHRNLHGGSSVETTLLEEVTGQPGGPPVRWYPADVNGTFVGQHFEIYQPTMPGDFVVTTIGWDHDRVIPAPWDASVLIPAPAAYFEAAIPEGTTVPAGSIILSKQFIEAMSVTSEDHCGNQAAALHVQKKVYGQGDTFGSEVDIWYQGNIRSGPGDEGAHSYTTYIIHDLWIFNAVVQDFSVRTASTGQLAGGELTYQLGAQNVERLGSCRPIINMNQGKWIKTGKVRVYRTTTYPGGERLGITNGVVQGVGTDWTPAVVGRYLAFNVAPEYLPAKDPLPAWTTPQRPIYRWFRITRFLIDPDPANPNRQFLFLQPTDGADGAPPLLDNLDFYNYNPTTGAELDYMIAPGAVVSDASRGTAMKYHGQTEIDRVLLLQPHQDFTRWPGPGEQLSGQAVFDTNDPVEQAIGPMPWNPTGYRAVHGSNFPSGPGGEYSFYGINLGTTSVGCGLGLYGKTDSATLQDGEEQYPRGKAAYRTGILLNAVTNVGIHLAGDIRPDPHGVAFLGAETDAGLGIALEQATGNRKVIAWSTHPAQEDGPQAYATLGFDPDTTTFFLRAGPGAAQNRSRVSVNGAALADVRGISAPGPTAQPANNLRGINVPVTGDPTQAQVTFVDAATGHPSPEPDPENAPPQYGIQVTTSWPTIVSITAKRNTGFRVEFETPAPPGGTFDWFLVR